MSSLERMIGLLDLFTPETPVWASESLIEKLGVPDSTGYRYIKVLHNAGLLARVANGSYVIGPRILELDRTSRVCDPVFQAGTALIRKLTQETGFSTLLSVLYSDSIMCVQQEATADAPPGLFSRGQRRPLVGGATANVILAYLPPHQLRSVFSKQRNNVIEANLGEDWDTFKKNLKAIRQNGYSMTSGEFRMGIAGLAAPIFNPEGGVLGSIALAAADGPSIREHYLTLAPIVAETARQITERIGKMSNTVLLPARSLR
jgi:DNA-binding IclR family transcriptional regulator